jgi:hypothetical protein
MKLKNLLLKISLFLLLPVVCLAQGWEGQYFNQHTDQDKTAPANEQVYKWNDTQQLWILGNMSAGGSSYNQSLNSTDAVTFKNVTVTPNAYSSSWNNSNKTVTEDAAYDKIETLIAGGGEATTVANSDTVNLTLTGAEVKADINATYKNTLITTSF